MVTHPDPEKRTVENYLKTEKRHAETALVKAMEAASRGSRLNERARRHLERAPWDSPLRAIIGLMKTASFTQEAQVLETERQTP